MSDLDSLEHCLADEYRLQATHYDEALRIVNEDAQALELDHWANDLQAALLQVARVEERMAPIKHTWEKSKRSPGLELRSVLDSVAIRIRHLTNAIDHRSHELLLRKQRLLPVMDEFIRHRHMLQSYEQFGKTK